MTSPRAVDPVTVERYHKVAGIALTSLRAGDQVTVERDHKVAGICGDWIDISASSRARDWIDIAAGRGSGYR